MKIHELKVWDTYYDSLESGQKNFEVRKNDRNFQVGDLLLLNCFNPKKETYNGEKCLRRITYILHGDKFGIEKEYCVIGLKIIE